MKNRLGREEEALHRAVSEVLHYIWDPIGVAGTVGARDEYDGYVGHVCSLLWQGASAIKISQHLIQISNENMGVCHAAGHADYVAEKLLEWRETIKRLPA